MLQLQASLIASGIEGAVGPYLQTAAETLTQMNQTGIPMDSEILSVFSALVNSSRSAERVSQTVLGVHNAIKGSSGESNAALQAIFGSAGIGGRSVGGAQAAIRSGGLFGVDPGKAKNVLGLSDEDIAAFQKENIISKDGRGGFKDRAGGITKFLNQIKKDIGVTGAGRVAMKMGFGDDEVTAMGAVSQLEKALSSNNEGEIEKIRKKLDDASKGPQDRMLDAQKGILRNLDKINTSAAAQLLKTEAMNNNISETLGGAIAPAVIEMKKLMGNIDRGIIYIASFLGMEDNTQGNQKSAMKLPSKARVEEAFSREQSLRAELKDVESRLESESDPSVIAELKKRRASLGEGIATTQADLGDYREAAKKFEARGKQGDFSGGMMGNPRGLSQKESTQATELLEILKDYMKQSASAMKNIDKNTRKVKAGAKGDTTR